MFKTLNIFSRDSFSALISCTANGFSRGKALGQLTVNRQGTKKGVFENRSQHAARSGNTSSRSGQGAHNE